MKYKMQALGGLCTAVLIWLPLLFADMFDEWILNDSCTVGAIAFLLAPVALFVWYAVHCVKTKPEAKPLLVWHACYIALSLPLWGIIASLVNQHKWIIEQPGRASFMDMNGLEYIGYGFSALCLFEALCILFHIIRIVVKKCRKPGAAA